MFFSIFKYELSYWLRQPSVYIYALIFLLGSMLGMAGNAELFDPHTKVTGSIQLVNAPIKILEMFVFWTNLTLLLLPTIIGHALYRDYKSQIYTLLYAYPIKKSAYLAAKFCSSFLVVFLLVSCIGLGIFLGTQVPGVNPALLGPFQFPAYWQSFLAFVVPNILSFGLIVFALVCLTRNIYSGFITIVCLFFLQGLFAAILSNVDYQYLAAIFDPFGEKASAYPMKFWTLAEKNSQLVPIGTLALANRLLWFGIALTFFTWVFAKFQFGQFTSHSHRKKVLESAKPLALGSIQKVNLPTIHLDFSLKGKFQRLWSLSKIHFLYIIQNWSFISILICGFLFTFFQQMQLNPAYGVKTLPITWKLLRIPGTLFSGVILILTFLFAGMLVQRERLAKMNQLVDSCPIPNWVLMGSKFLALVKMQILLLSLLIIGGILTQTLQGFYRFEIGHYFFEVYVLYGINFLIWAFVAILIQTIFTNPYLGLILLLLGALGMAGLPEIGIHSAVLRYNMGPNFEYSDLEGYGHSLVPHLIYKTYWTLFGLILLILTSCWWIRGIPHNFWERLKIAINRFSGLTRYATLLLLFAFLFLGFKIYQNDEGLHEVTAIENEEAYWKAENEKRYGSLRNIPQPKISAVNLNLDLYPSKGDLLINGHYVLNNKTDQVIDSLLLHFSFEEFYSYSLERPFKLLHKDSQLRFEIIQLAEALQPNDSCKLNFELKNKTNTIFHQHSKVKPNGTYFYNNIFPGIGYRQIDIKNNNQRSKYGLNPVEHPMPMPTDTAALQYSYSSYDADWIDFEAIISTTIDQQVIAPGYLQRYWITEDRHFYHYKMDQPIKDYYGFNSGRFAVLKDEWEDVALEIYYHPNHDYNIDRMMAGLKAALAYNSKHFTPYQHQQARIIEFPLTLGTHGTTFANSIPISEVHFIADVNDGNPTAIDLPFYVTAHEVAHQWWGNQLNPANVRGAKMLTESLAEYSALKTLETTYGKAKVQPFLEVNRLAYLSGRANETGPEPPLIYSFPNQDYINYRKGALAFYTLSHYLGEAKLNEILANFLQSVRFQEPPYTSSLALLAHLKSNTPDSLQYLFIDFFETTTLYNNTIEHAEYTEIGTDKYLVKVDLSLSKYRMKDAKTVYEEHSKSLSLQSKDGQALRSLPLSDFISIGIYNDQKQEIQLQDFKCNQIQNTLYLEVDELPHTVKLDPYFHQIELDISDINFKFNPKYSAMKKLLLLFCLSLLLSNSQKITHLKVPRH